jgi:hypothetical protein
MQSLREALEANVGLSASDALALAAVLEGALESTLRNGSAYSTRPFDTAPAVLTPDTARATIDRVIARCGPYPADRFDGRGVVVCAGGNRLLRCAWVCVNMLRRAGCTLPIEMWQLDATEIDAATERRFASLGVRCVNAAEVRQREPVRILRGWELKPFALLHSSFREPLLLDADNVPIRDPSYLFESAQFASLGAIFWPDVSGIDRSNPIWDICGLERDDGADVESGQLLVDKARCWTALQVAMHMNEYSDFYYRYVHGDKSTFFLAWRVLGQRFGMPDRAPGRLHGTFCQHDFDGRRVFQHRHQLKWDARLHVEGFVDEAHCWRLLDEFDNVAGSAV